MSKPTPPSDYLVLSRGQWEKNAAKEDIEAAIQKSCEWYAGNVESGSFKSGSPLSTEVAMVSKAGIATDGPFGEDKEISGGYWIIVARSLWEAADIAAQNPCIPHGLRFESRPLETGRASAYNVTNKNPGS